jgi:hypothetical protein
MYSYHVFIYPFQWEHNSLKHKPFGERFELNKVMPGVNSYWKNMPEPETDQYRLELYNEKNFFYEFVHNALYDDGSGQNSVLRHYERKETVEGLDVFYEISVKSGKEQVYRLPVKSITLDIYATGTGLLTFYLTNSQYSDFGDIKRINQFGRRVYPPFIELLQGIDGTKKFELADYIAIQGLLGEEARYTEDFNTYGHKDTWKAGRFVQSLIQDLDPGLEIHPVVDDRMFTMCWYLNKDLASKIAETKSYHVFVQSNEWHEFLYVDGGGSSCQNLQMQKKLLESHTYPRWQKYGTLYGITRHSFMAISGEGEWTERVLLGYFRTHYVRMAGLTLVQRASVLKFSEEVTHLSRLPEKDTQSLADNISTFYQAYIRFVNQIYFREITAQDQGIELYNMLHESLGLKEQVKDLDNEISELHNYATLLDEKAQSRNLGLLTILGSLFLAPSFIVGFFGMNTLGNGVNKGHYSQLLLTILIVLSAGILYGVVHFHKKSRKKDANILIGLMAVITLAMLILTLIFNKQ